MFFGTLEQRARRALPQDASYGDIWQKMRSPDDLVEIFINEDFQALKFYPVQEQMLKQVRDGFLHLRGYPVALKEMRVWVVDNRICTSKQLIKSLRVAWQMGVVRYFVEGIFMMAVNTENIMGYGGIFSTEGFRTWAYAKAKQYEVRKDKKMIGRQGLFHGVHYILYNAEQS